MSSSSRGNSNTTTCFFKRWPGAGPCDGKLIAAHLIPKQLIRREVCSARTAGSSGRWPVTVDQRAELARILWDPRVVVPCCGGPMGLSGHHGMLDVARKLRIPRDRLPDAVEEFAAEHGLTWWLERGYEIAGTCDWGGCDDGAVSRRFSPGQGWLPVCQEHRAA